MAPLWNFGGTVVECLWKVGMLACEPTEGSLRPVEGQFVVHDVSSQQTLAGKPPDKLLGRLEVSRPSRPLVGH